MDQLQFIKKINNTPWDERLENSYRLEESIYNNLHTDVLLPTNIKVEVDSFRNTMEKYAPYFKSWSVNRPELSNVRKGLPLVNVNGDYTITNDFTIGPLDYYNKCNPAQKLLETDITTPTAILNETCFDCFDEIKPYMIRSSILKWSAGANFLPHIDMVIPALNLRLWGTDNPTNIKLKIEKHKTRPPWFNFDPSKYNFIDPDIDIEPGRLYLFDSTIIHEAICEQGSGYQFFIALSLNACETLKTLLLQK